MKAKAFTALVEEVAKLGVEVTVRYRNDRMEYDLNTGMKSGCVLVNTVEDSPYCYAYMRYDVVDEVVDLDDVFTVVENCLYGRDFANPQWVDAFQKTNRVLF